MLLKDQEADIVSLEISQLIIQEITTLIGFFLKISKKLALVAMNFEKRPQMRVSISSFCLILRESYT